MVGKTAPGRGNRPLSRPAAAHWPPWRGPASTSSKPGPRSPSVRSGRWVQKGEVLPSRAAVTRLQLLRHRVSPTEGIVNAAELHVCPAAVTRRHSPRQHNCALGFPPAGPYLVHPPRPEPHCWDIIVGHTQPGPPPCQRPRLDPGLVVHDVAAQQFTRSGDCSGHRIQQPAGPPGAGVHPDRCSTSSRTGPVESPLLHRIGAGYHCAGGRPDPPPKHPGCRQSGGQHSLRPLIFMRCLSY